MDRDRAERLHERPRDSAPRRPGFAKKTKNDDSKRTTTNASEQTVAESATPTSKCTITGDALSATNQARRCSTPAATIFSSKRKRPYKRPQNTTFTHEGAGTGHGRQTSAR
jgi:hypothetical protein